METTAEAMQESEVTSENVKVCCLYGGKGGYMFRFKRWGEEETRYALAHLSTLTPPNSIACKKIQN